MSELDKLRAARHVLAQYSCNVKENGPDFMDYLIREIARLSDPHAEAKEIIDGWERFGSVDKGVKVRNYVRHLESELAITRRALELACTGELLNEGFLDYCIGLATKELESEVRK